VLQRSYTELQTTRPRYGCYGCYGCYGPLWICYVSTGSFLVLLMEFYNLHRLEANNSYYLHSLIFSPQIVVFHDGYGGWIEPFQVNVLTSAAVSTGEVHKALHGQMPRRVIEADIESQMGILLSNKCLWMTWQ